MVHLHDINIYFFFTDLQCQKKGISWARQNRQSAHSLHFTEIACKPHWMPWFPVWWEWQHEMSKPVLFWGNLGKGFSVLWCHELYHNLGKGQRRVVLFFFCVCVRIGARLIHFYKLILLCSAVILFPLQLHSTSHTYTIMPVFIYSCSEVVMVSNPSERGIVSAVVSRLGWLTEIRRSSLTVETTTACSFNSSLGS